MCYYIHSHMNYDSFLIKIFIRLKDDYRLCRVNSLLDNVREKVSKLEAVGCRRVIKEKLGARKERPNFKVILEKLRPGDTIIVTGIDQVADSLKQLSHALNRIRIAQAHIHFLDLNIDTSKTPELLEVARHFAEFDSAITRNKPPVAKRGPKRRFSDEKIREMVRMYNKGAKVTEVCVRFGVSEPSFWRFLRQCR